MVPDGDAGQMAELSTGWWRGAQLPRILRTRDRATKGRDGIHFPDYLFDSYPLHVCTLLPLWLIGRLLMSGEARCV